MNIEVKYNSILLLSAISFFLSSTFLRAQNVIDQISDTTTPSLSEFQDLTEKILRISKDKRIFILTNENASVSQGDFFSIIFENELVARALVAKNVDQKTGIKILRIYSPGQWEKLREGLEIQILRGDDTSFQSKKNDKEEKEEEKVTLITREDDLFDETKLLQEDLELEAYDNSVVKNNNIIAVSLGFLESSKTGGEVDNHSQVNVSWAYQFEPNLWLEGNYGRNVINGFPSEDIETALDNLTFKVKYSVDALFYSIIMPYIGYQKVIAHSPNAGENDPNNEIPASQLKNELNDVANLEKNHIIFGINILKRLVPGWFIKLDVGSDIMSAGLALEF